jgi:hypothetical protein
MKSDVEASPYARPVIGPYARLMTGMKVAIIPFFGLYNQAMSHTSWVCQEILFCLTSLALQH